MLVTWLTKDKLRRERSWRSRAHNVATLAETPKLLADGWEEVGEGGSRLWELCRGGRWYHQIVDVKIAPSGKALLVKIEKI